MSNEKFEYFGVYYKEDVPTLGEKKFRIFLDIKRFDIAQTEPDLMVIMMNPGGSKPISHKKTTDGYYPSQEDARNAIISKRDNLKSINKIVLDLMVILMNLGRSKLILHKKTTDGYYPSQEDARNAIISNIDDLESIWEDVDPDKTQDQITSVMNRVKDASGGYRFNYARVLNLSDICEPNSSTFYKNLTKLKENDGVFPHSIFNREDLDLAILFKKNVPVILAWCVGPSSNKVNINNYKKLCIKALEYVKEQKGINKEDYELEHYREKQVFGYEHQNYDADSEDNNYRFYHPLCRRRPNWKNILIQQIEDQLNAQNVSED